MTRDEIVARRAGRLGPMRVVALLALSAISTGVVTAQVDSTELVLPVDSLMVDTVSVPQFDSAARSEQMKAAPLPTIVTRFNPSEDEGAAIRTYGVLHPIASPAELYLGYGLLQSHRTMTPAFPSTFSYGSSGPLSVPILLDGTLLETSNSTPVEPIFLTTFRIGDVEVLRGIDASLFVSSDARAGLNVIPPTFDVAGSYVRFGYTGSPGDVARVAFLFARNLGSDKGISVNFRRTPGADINSPNDKGDIIGGDIEFDYYPDEVSRVAMRLNVDELDREDNGGIRDDGLKRYEGLLVERRRRRLSVDYTRYTDAPSARDGGTVDSTDPGQSGPNARGSMIAASLYYQHDGRYLDTASTRLGADVADIVGLTGTVIERLSPVILLRSHLQGSLSNGGIGRLHAAATVVTGSGGIELEAGGAVSGDADYLQPALLAGVSGSIDRIAWEVDGRYYPGDITSSLRITGYPNVDNDPGSRVATRWLAEGRGVFRDGTLRIEAEAGLRGYERESTTGTGLDIGADVRLPIGPFTFFGGGALTSDLGLENLYPTIRSSSELGYPFDLFRGALDLYLGVSAELQSTTGGFRYDPILDLWYSDPGDRENPIPLNPLLSAVATARIGTAFFSFEFFNLLNNEYWTIRRRPWIGRGLRFGLTWGLID